MNKNNMTVKQKSHNLRVLPKKKFTNMLANH